VGRLIVPCAAPPAFWKTMLPIWTDPGSSTYVSGVITPDCRAATAVIGFKVEPVGYRPSITRSTSGAPVSTLFNFLNVDSLSGLANRLGSKLG
jgi:hypothetical protein